MKRGKNTKLRLFIFFLLILAAFQTPFALVNAPRFQQWFLRTYRPFSPWQVNFDALHLAPWRLKLDITNLNFTHPSGHKIVVDSFQLRIKPLRLLRGQLAVEALEIHSPTITLAKSLVPEKEEPKKQFKIRTLLLFENLIIDESRIENITLNFSDGKNIKVENLNLKLSRSLFGGTELSLDLNGTQFQNELGEKKSIQNLNVAVITNFSHWSKTFPYADDVEGDLSIQETSLGQLQIKKIEAKLRFDKNKLTSKKFSIQIGENALQGKLESELQNQKFSLNLEIPKPIHLPEIGSEIRTFNTAGQLTANLEIEGQGFDIKTSHGKGTLKATHRFEGLEDHPVEVGSQFDWEKGIMHLKETKVTVDNANVEASGTIDLSPPALHLNLKAQEFPIERFFDKFVDKNLHPIHGRGNIEAALNGFDKSIHLQLTGEIAKEGGYGFLMAEKVQAALDLTYERLKLDGKILTGGKPTGDAEFIINYGSKLPGQARSKKISLLAKLHGQPLETTLPGLHLKGDADGELKLNGSPQDIRGDGVLTAIQGSFFDEGFEIIKTHFNLTSKKLVVDKADFTFANFTTNFIKPLTLDFTLGGFKLSGQPLAGYSVDVDYQGANTHWQINKLTVEDPSNPSLKAQVNGAISPTGIDLKGQGVLELSRLRFLTKYIRDASGPSPFQLAVHGASPNLQINGKVQFDGNMLSLRAYPYSFEDLKGVLNFQGNRIATSELTGSLGTGSFKIKGELTHTQGKVSNFDLKLSGNQLFYRNEPGDFHMEYDADLALKGLATNPELSGSLIILDGRYTKNFNIIEEFKEGSKPSKEIQQAASEGPPIRLNVKVRNLGDLTIDNNVGKIELTADVNVQGTNWIPRIEGSVATNEGKVHYLGLDFDITRGFIEFRDPYVNPYLEVDAEQDVADVHITAKLHGRTNNLVIDLSGNSTTEGALEKKDVLSLILFGMTTNERLQQATFFQQDIGPELVAEQITHALQRPVASFTHLDVFRLEAKPTQTGRNQTFYIGKTLSDRLTAEFASEVNSQIPVQTFRLDYWLTDFLIFSGSRRTDESYQLNLGFRFTSR